MVNHVAMMDYLRNTLNMLMDRCVTVLLSIFYTGAIRHGYLPGDFMKTIIIPLVKNKSGDLSDVNNYRPIALVTVVSNNFENILLELMEPYLSTTDNQFGFKKGHSTDHCIRAKKCYTILPKL